MSAQHMLRLLGALILIILSVAVLNTWLDRLAVTAAQVAP